jgi:hypothetical protein
MSRVHDAMHTHTRFSCSRWAGDGPGCRRAARLILATVFVTACVAQVPTFLDMDNAHCGKKFRIATHHAPPFIIINDFSKCVDQKCSPEAFGENGGVVYKLMMDHILPQLRTYCKVLHSACSSLVRLFINVHAAWRVCCLTTLRGNNQQTG